MNEIFIDWYGFRNLIIITKNKKRENAKRVETFSNLASANGASLDGTFRIGAGRRGNCWLALLLNEGARLALRSTVRHH